MRHIYSKYIWVRSRNCGCPATWLCHKLIAKQATRQPQLRDPTHIYRTSVAQMTSVSQLHVFISRKGLCPFICTMWALRNLGMIWAILTPWNLHTWLYHSLTNGSPVTHICVSGPALFQVVPCRLLVTSLTHLTPPDPVLTDLYNLSKISVKCYSQYIV